MTVAEMIERLKLLPAETELYYMHHCCGDEALTPVADIDPDKMPCVGGESKEIGVIS